MANESEFILNFFNNSGFKPILLQEPILIQWPQDEDEFVFTSPTSLITKDVVE